MTPDLRYIILLLVLVVQGYRPVQAQPPDASPGPLCQGLALYLSAAPSDQVVASNDWPIDRVAWDSRLVPTGRVRPHRNPRRNWERWQQRLARQCRRQPQQARRQRRRRQKAVVQRLLGIPPSPRLSPLVVSGPPVASAPSMEVKPPVPPDPLAELRQSRGWIDQMDEDTLWDLLRRIRWAHGVQCPRCGERDPRYLEVIDQHYRGGMWRHRCLVCAQAGDPGEGGTFTDLTGTLFEGTRLDIRTLWLVVEMFVEGEAAVETADEAGVNRHTTQRLFRLLRGAIYQARSTEPIALGPKDVVEGDEVYITAGVKGQAGGLELEREPRKRGLKRRGRGDWDSDRLPVFGLLCRGGQVRLFVLRNVQSETIRPIVHQMVMRGVKVYTDSYSIYHFLSREGYQHRTVNHSAGEYARDEVHCNTMESTWSWLRQMIRTYRGVSKVYLPLYVTQFEFFYNRRHDSRWSRMLDVMLVAFQADAASLLARVDGAEFAEVCLVAG